jgi:hypothetical protein
LEIGRRARARIHLEVSGTFGADDLDRTPETVLRLEYPNVDVRRAVIVAPAGMAARRTTPRDQPMRDGDGRARHLVHVSDQGSSISVWSYALKAVCGITSVHNDMHLVEKTPTILYLFQTEQIHYSRALSPPLRSNPVTFSNSLTA